MEEVEVSTKFGSRQVWLVKAPSFLADAWSNIGSGVDLGTVKIKEDKVRPGILPEMKISIRGDYAAEFPKEYELECTPVDAPTLGEDSFVPHVQIFSESSDGKVAFEGTVEHKCDIKPNISPEYRKLMRGRLEKSMKKERVTQTIQAADVEYRAVGRDLNKKRKAEEKRERMDKDELMNAVFSIFEKRTFFDLKSITSMTNQPTLYLKTILDEICIYNKRGPHKGMYELRPQYKNRTSNVQIAPPMIPSFHIPEIQRQN